MVGWGVPNRLRSASPHLKTNLSSRPSHSRMKPEGRNTEEGKGEKSGDGQLVEDAAPEAGPWRWQREGQVMLTPPGHPFPAVPAPWNPRRPQTSTPSFCSLADSGFGSCGVWGRFHNLREAHNAHYLYFPSPETLAQHHQGHLNCS